MMKQTVICPGCKAEIPLTETLFEQVRAEVRNEIDAETKIKEAELKKREAAVQQQLQQVEQAKKDVDAEVKKRLDPERTVLLGRYNTKVKEIETQNQKKDEELRTKKTQLDKKSKELEIEKKNIDSKVAKRLQEEKADLEKQLKEQAQKAVATELDVLKTENSELDQKLQESKKNELGLLKQKRELEDAKQNLELEVAKRVDKELDRARSEAIEKTSEEHRLKDKEKDKKIADFTTKIEELNRKLEQGSQQTQGEVGELELEDILKGEFHFDSIEPVGKGTRGGDILQKVNTQGGEFCGSILWETKRTKAWSEGWVQKVKDDQQEASASLAVIVSEALPPGFRHFRQLKGVWVTDFKSALGLALALRMSLMEVAKARQALAGKSEKMELVYAYLTSPQFKNRVEAMIEPFLAMKNDLLRERLATEKNWAKREKQMDRIVANLAGFHGDLEAIVGTSLPSIKVLELPVAPSEEPAASELERAENDVQRRAGLPVDHVPI